jgi:hypothetical protein
MESILQTPWGRTTSKQELATGVFWVETSEHGGLLINASQAQSLLSERARTIGKPWESFLAFEQEHDMLVVFYEHPEFYPWIEEDLTEKLAADGLYLFHPDYFYV